MNASQKKTMVLGCGIIVAVILVVVIVAAGVSFGFTVRLMHSAVPKLAPLVAKDYADFKATNRVPADHAALYEELAKMAAQPDATFQLLIVVKAVLDLHLDDGKVSDAELAQATAVRDYFKANPTASYFAVSRFIRQYPNLDQEITRAGTSLLTATSQ